MARSARAAAGRKPKRARTLAPPCGVFRFVVELHHVTPRVWRLLQVPDTYTFWDLHVAIQDAMGWLDRHLHEFRIRHPQNGAEQLIGIPDDEYPEERPCLAGWNVLLSDYFGPGALPVTYAYDFGDGWEHTLHCEAWFAPDPLKSLLQCVDGAGACPPEDCGGPHGYRHVLDALANPRHPEHTEMKEWIGRDFDPNAFESARVVFDNPRKRWERAFTD